jgi:two-component system, chemotaxis family, CheB/CheR fusion protein
MREIESKIAGRGNNSSTNFTIVGIGASAGGLEALESFFKNMPPDSGLAFVVIQHMDPNFKNMLPELLQKTTLMAVSQIKDKLKVCPNQIYVIPPNKTLTIENGFLHLSIPKEERGLRLPIDTFFHSLALDQLDKSVGIILSGMGSDGSEGIKEIKKNKGLVLVQDPTNAKSASMPQSAIAKVNPNCVAPADKLPVKLMVLLQSKPIANDEERMTLKERQNLDTIIVLLREQTGHDFTLYKKSTLIRRVGRRKGIHQIDKIQNYVRFLKENPKEVELLFKELLIGVTNFFRDTLVWEKLKNQVVPDVINQLPDGYTLRAWIPACSTGEEAYSLAIIFKEVIDTLAPTRNITLQIFATDLDTDAIDKARKGIFSDYIVGDVSLDRLRKYFIQEEEGYRISTSVREMVVFAPHNVTKDPPFTRLNFLFCRNMLIYMEPTLQKQLMELFYYSLVPGGVLLLGSAETLGRNNKGFEIIDSKLKFFQRIHSSIRPDLSEFPNAFSYNRKMISKDKITNPTSGNIQTITDHILLQQFAPASVLVNEKGDIIYITGKTGKYLEPVAGKANWNIHAMARDEIKNELPDAFRKALQSYDPIILKNIKIKNGANSSFVTLTVQQIASPDIIKGMVLVVFTDVSVIIEHEVSNVILNKSDGSGRAKEQENKLAICYQDLQNTREEMQTSQEELKSINEELQSTNEELQSTNEELTTSKEEMQSLNEELQTVNAELQSKLIDFEQANNDMKNLLNSTEIATLFIDKELNIRRFTDSITKIFKLRLTDIGRPFTDLTTDLQYPEIGVHAIQVIKDLIPIQNTIATNDGRWFYVRILPYRTIDDRIDGLVITFTDITIAQQAEEILVSEKNYRHFFESAKEGIFFLDIPTGKIIDLNYSLLNWLGTTKEQVAEKPIWEIDFFKSIFNSKKQWLELEDKEVIFKENITIQTFDEQPRTINCFGNAYESKDRKIIQFFIRDK